MEFGFLYQFGFITVRKYLLKDGLNTLVHIVTIQIIYNKLHTSGERMLRKFLMWYSCEYFMKFHILSIFGILVLNRSYHYLLNFIFLKITSKLNLIEISIDLHV